MSALLYLTDADIGPRILRPSLYYLAIHAIRRHEKEKGEIILGF
jgi:hypothetical protein